MDLQQIAHTSSTTLPALLGLPLELRYQIYYHLCPEDPICYPSLQSPFSSISHQGPPRAIMLTCRQLTSELQAYYYGLTTFKFLALARSRLSRQDMSIGSLCSLRNAKKFELRIMWRFHYERLEKDMQDWPWYMTGWVKHMVEILQEEASNMEVVTISLMDSSDLEGYWEMKRPLLEPLQMLKGRVRFQLGEVTSVRPDGTNEKELKDVVSELNSA